MEDGPVSAPYQIICEGSADRVFLTRLLQSPWGVTDFAVRCTHTTDSRRCAGRSGLKDTLLAVDAVRATINGSLRGIAIVFDSDDDPAGRFNEIIEAIRASKLGYPKPTAPLEISKGDPSIGVVLLPWFDRPGHLDELLFESLKESHSDLLTPVEDYQAATSHRIGDWKFGSKSKMRLRCVIAASHEPDPGVALSYLLETSKSPVDFHHKSFDQLMTFFDDFRRKV
jgi:hypothetical protein